MFYYTEDLVTSMKLITLAPSSQQTFQDSDMIQIANDEMQLKLVSDIQSIREDFFLNYNDQTVVGSQSAYYIPTRAIGNALKSVTFLDPQGNESAPLNRIPVERAYLFGTGSVVPSAFYLQGDQVVVLPKQTNGSGTLRQYFFQRPNQIVSTTACAQITSVTSAAGITTLGVNTNLTASLTPGSTADFLRARSPFMLSALDVTIVSCSTNQMTVSTTAISDINSTVLPSVGDWICPAGKANIPQVPQEFHPVLAAMGGVRLLAALGDLNKLAAAKAELKELRMEALRIVKNRVESAPEKVDTRGSLSGRIGTRYGLR